ncbi:MAG: hypothetical protein ACOX46_03540 [Limnochordia bacterium]
MLYLVDTGLGPIGGGWLTWEPREGSVPAGASLPITVQVDTSDLGAGTYTGKVVLTTNDREKPPDHGASHLKRSRTTGDCGSECRSPVMGERPAGSELPGGLRSSRDSSDQCWLGLWRWRQLC